MKTTCSLVIVNAIAKNNKYRLQIRIDVKQTTNRSFWRFKNLSGKLQINKNFSMRIDWCKLNFIFIYFFLFPAIMHPLINIPTGTKICQGD